MIFADAEVLRYCIPLLNGIIEAEVEQAGKIRREGIISHGNLDTATTGWAKKTAHFHLLDVKLI